MLSPKTARALVALTAAAAVTGAGVVTAVALTDHPGVQPVPAAAPAAADPASQPRPAAVEPTGRRSPTPARTAADPAGRPSPAADRSPASGLTGPVSRVLATAPDKGPIRVVVLTADATGQRQTHVSTVPSRAAATSAIEAARALPGALAVTIDQRVRIASTETTQVAAATTAHVAAAPATSNDTYRNGQWALDKLQAETAWTYHDASEQTVAVIDSGVASTHEDLVGAVLPGIDYVAPGDGSADQNGHGTHVAGIIAANVDNGVGIAGLARGAKILPVRVLGADGSGWTSDVASGIRYAADHGATVINLSLSGNADPVVADAVSYAQGKDLLVVAAAGNSRQACPAGTTPSNQAGCGNPVTYPAAYPGVLAVAATDASNASAVFSETGSFVGIAAPGVRISSTFTTGGYKDLSGTSMASPYIAATAALLRAADPALTSGQVLSRLTATAKDLGAPGRDDEFGAGLVDPVAALAATVPAPATSTSPAPSPTTTTSPSPPTLVAAPPAAPVAPAPPVAAPVGPAPAPVFPAPDSVVPVPTTAPQRPVAPKPTAAPRKPTAAPKPTPKKPTPAPGAVTVTRPTVTAKRGAPVPVAGTIAKAKSGSPVYVQMRQKNGQWTTISQARLNVRGQFATALKAPRTAGSYQYRVYVPATRTSKVITVRVT